MLTAKVTAVADTKSRIHFVTFPVHNLQVQMVCKTTGPIYQATYNVLIEHLLTVEVFVAKT
jgi:hypothetical protein